MRQKINLQDEFEFAPSTLKITNQYFEKYTRISDILDEHPDIIELIDRDLNAALKKKQHRKKTRRCRYSSDTLLRILVAQIIEGETLRGIVIRIDDSGFLRGFVRIHNGRMMDYTTLDILKNNIQPETWKEVTRVLAKASVETGVITGEKLRVDTTACETNIHWPTDSSLLWDTFRVTARLIRVAKEIDPDLVGNHRLQDKCAKRLHTWLARKAGKKNESTPAVAERYQTLIDLVGNILLLALTVVKGLKEGLSRNAYDVHGFVIASGLIQELQHYHELGAKVVAQAYRRVINGEMLPSTEKLYSIFEPHTELLKRGKAGKPIEFGHIIFFQQVEEKFITDYDVFSRKPIDYDLIDPALESHKRLFGILPTNLSGDKGFYQSMDKNRQLEETIEVVSIGKKGKRTKEETKRESSPPFKMGQRFRAGIEGTISFLKRALGMFRCLNKGWEHYAATVGMAVLTHNLLILARK